MIDSKTRLFCSIVLVLVLAIACTGRTTVERPPPRDDVEEEEEPATELVRSDPAVLATFEPWEASCIRWLRGDCRKSSDCDRGLAPECDDDDETLRATCNEMADGCAEPDPLSFDRCLSRTTEETCAEFCDIQVCVNVCVFSCLD